MNESIGSVGKYLLDGDGIICSDRARTGTDCENRGSTPLSSAIFHFARPTGWPFLLACLPREITGCFDGPILQLRGSAAGFHFSSKVNLILSARIVSPFRSVCATERVLCTQTEAQVDMCANMCKLFLSHLSLTKCKKMS